MDGGLVRIEIVAVASIMRAARFVARESAENDESRDNEHILRFPSLHRCELLRKENPRPVVDTVERVLESRFVANDPAETLHDALERVAHVGDVETRFRSVRRLDRTILKWKRESAISPARRPVCSP